MNKSYDHKVLIAGGATEDGIPVGNIFDKYASRNPVVRYLMAGFGTALESMVDSVAPASIHEVGCGEGYWVLRWITKGMDARGSDFSEQVINLARENLLSLPREFEKIEKRIFRVRSIYDLSLPEDAADLVVCCEVLEHLENPDVALSCLRNITRRYCILSVPNEPIWRILNMARGRYLSDFGNTPGHIQHWSPAGFLRLISKYFTIVDIKKPLPWIMILGKPRND